ncbi:hypothetical protein GW755_02360 [bacterium]|nr:hypothetical protein [bacterium]
MKSISGLRALEFNPEIEGLEDTILGIKAEFDRVMGERSFVDPESQYLGVTNDQEEYTLTPNSDGRISISMKYNLEPGDPRMDVSIEQGQHLELWVDQEEIGVAQLSNQTTRLHEILIKTPVLSSSAALVEGFSPPLVALLKDIPLPQKVEELVRKEISALCENTFNAVTRALANREVENRHVIEWSIEGSQYSLAEIRVHLLENEAMIIEFFHTQFPTKKYEDRVEVRESIVYSHTQHTFSTTTPKPDSLLPDLRKFEYIIRSCPLIPAHRHGPIFRFNYQGGYIDIKEDFLTVQEITSIKILGLARHIGYFSNLCHDQINSNMSALTDDELYALNILPRDLLLFDPEKFWGWEREFLKIDKNAGLYPVSFKDLHKTRVALAIIKQYLINWNIDQQNVLILCAELQNKQYELAEKIETEAERIYDLACEIVPESLDGDYHIITLVHKGSNYRHKVYLSRDKDRMFIESEYRYQKPPKDLIKYVFDCYPDNKEIMRSRHTEEVTVVDRDRKISFVGVGGQSSVIGTLNEADITRIQNIGKLLSDLSQIDETELHRGASWGDFYYSTFG